MKMGVKGNNGKAAKSKVANQFIVISVAAVMLIGGVKVFGTAPWNSKAVPREGQVMHDVRAAQNLGRDAEESKLSKGTIQSDGSKITHLPGGDEKDSNFIQFEFSNLDGEEGSTGIVVIELHPEWAPLGVERIKELTAASFWEGCRFFRVLPNFIAQIGIHGDTVISEQWFSKRIKDDEVVQTNERGTVTFAMAGPGTRTSQIFINTGRQNAFLDKQGFAPFGRVISGMDVVDRIYDGYREKPKQGRFGLVACCLLLHFDFISILPCFGCL
jgi:cyclophilin family peptidyl-prolyl cis-trans isomerase